MNATALSSDTLFQKLCQLLAGNPKLSAMVTADLRARTKHATLPNYHNNGAAEESKVELYKLYITAIIEKNYVKLQGQVASGQAQVPVETEINPDPAPVNRVKAAKEKVETPAPVIVPVPVEAPAPAPVAVVEAPAPTSFEAILELRIASVVQRLMASQPKAATPEPISSLAVYADVRTMLMADREFQKSVEVIVREEIQDQLIDFRQKLRKEMLEACTNTRKAVISALTEGLSKANEA